MKRIIVFFKTRKAVFWYRVIIIVCILIFAGSLTKLFMIFHEYNSAVTEYEDIADEFTIKNEDVTGAGVSVTETSVKVVQTDENGKETVFVFQPLNVDFASLKAINEDVIGWIQFETFNLSYPIVKDPGDNYYLRRTIKKQNNSAGSLFISTFNNGDFQDTNTIIFGHNMRNGSMFGQLGRYKQESYFRNNQYFRIYTPNGMQRYQIFSVYKADVDGSAYSIWSWTGGKEYKEWIEELKSNSMYETGVGITENDIIVTLSTCVTGEDEKRLVLHAKLI